MTTTAVQTKQQVNKQAVSRQAPQPEQSQDKTTDEVILSGAERMSEELDAARPYIQELIEERNTLQLLVDAEKGRADAYLDGYKLAASEIESLRLSIEASRTKDVFKDQRIESLETEIKTLKKKVTRSRLQVAGAIIGTVVLAIILR